MSEPVNLFTLTSFCKSDLHIVRKGLNSYESGTICWWSERLYTRHSTYDNTPVAYKHCYPCRWHL